MRWLKKFWPRRLLGQTVLLVLVALLAAQIASAMILRSETRAIQRSGEIRLLAERTASMIALFEGTEVSRHRALSDAVSNRRLKVWVSDAPLISRSGPYFDTALAEGLQIALEALPDAPLVTDLRVAQEGVARGHQGFGRDGPFARDLRQSDAPRRAIFGDVFVSVPMAEARWLNLSLDIRNGKRLISAQGWISFLISALTISVIVFLLLRRLTKSLDGLSIASARLGRGEILDPLKEEGPADVRETIRAFNTMQERLSRFVTDRTRMVAAVSHDLRTPITSLRLRAEMVQDTELRDKMIATLADMQRMVEDTLAFAKEDAREEPTRNVNLTELLHAMADDLIETGYEVKIVAEADVVYPCRPVALRRAVQNITENACQYGQRAEIDLSTRDDDVSIVVRDDGPGIPEAKLGAVFEPFVTLDHARNKKTSGSGLGLAIARDIVRRHGGDITLLNRVPGGLEATITLPSAP